jgi:hypothetical protein
MVRFVPLSLGLLFAGASALRAADETPLDYFSSDAAVVVRLGAPEKTIERIAEMVDAIQPGAGAQITQQAGAIGVLISNPALAGVDQTKDWYIVVYAEGAGEPTAVFAIPTTDAKAMQEALPERFKSAVNGDWVYYTDKELPEEADDDDAISDNVSDEGAELLQASDIGLYVNVAQLTETYKTQLEDAEGKAREAIENLPNQVPNGEQLKPVMGMYTLFFDKIVDAVGDAEELTVSFKMDKAGLVIEDICAFAEDSDTAKRLASHPTSKLPLLAKLPAGSLGYLGLSADMQKLMQFGMKMNIDMVEDEAKKAELQKAMDGFKSISFKTMVTAFDLGDTESGLFKSVGVVEATPADKLKAQMRSVAASMGSIETAGIKQETTVEKDAETIGGTKIDIVTVKQEVDDANAAKMQEILFGADGMKSRIAYNDKGYIQTMGGGKPAMEAALKGFGASSSTNAAVAFQKQLLPTSNVTWMLDLPSFAVKAAKLAPAFGANLPFEASELDGLGVEESYMGGAIGIEKNAIRAKFTLPTAQAQNIAKLVIFGIQKQQQGR